MKKVDCGEFFDVSAEQYNGFAEYKSFPTEKYETSESAKSPLETKSVQEHFNDGNGTQTKADAKAESNSGDVRRQMEKANRAQSQSSSPSDTSASTSGT
ncbi:MAG: hypothetical protein ACI4QH_04710, partial [Candidatus Fimimonas sp.]